MLHLSIFSANKEYFFLPFYRFQWHPLVDIRFLKRTLNSGCKNVQSPYRINMQMLVNKLAIQKIILLKYFVTSHNFWQASVGCDWRASWMTDLCSPMVVKKLISYLSIVFAQNDGKFVWPLLPLDVTWRLTQLTQDLPELLSLLQVRAGCDASKFIEDDNFVNHFVMIEKDPFRIS